MTCNHPVGSDATVGKPERQLNAMVTDWFWIFLIVCLPKNGYYIRCIDGNWLGTPVICPDYCDMLSSNLEFYLVESNDLTRKLTTRGMPYTRRFTTICAHGTRLVNNNFSLIGPYSDCQHFNFTDTDICERNESFSYPRFTLIADFNYSQQIFTQTVFDLNSVIQDPHKAINFSSNTGHIEFMSKGQFSVGSIFSWYCFVWVEPAINNITLISWKADQRNNK